MTYYFTVYTECKNPDCDFKSDDQSNYDDEGYCMNCSGIKAEMQREASN